MPAASKMHVELRTAAAVHWTPLPWSTIHGPLFRPGHKTRNIGEEQQSERASGRPNVRKIQRTRICSKHGHRYKYTMRTTHIAQTGQRDTKTDFRTNALRRAAQRARWTLLTGSWKGACGSRERLSQQAIRSLKGSNVAENAESDRDRKREREAEQRTSKDQISAWTDRTAQLAWRFFMMLKIEKIQKKKYKKTEA